MPIISIQFAHRCATTCTMRPTDALRRVSHNGMVGPCACPASKRSCQGAPKISSMPCLLWLQKPPSRHLCATYALLPITNIHRRAHGGNWPPVYESALQVGTGPPLTIFLLSDYNPSRAVIAFGALSWRAPKRGAGRGARQWRRSSQACASSRKPVCGGAPGGAAPYVIGRARLASGHPG
jgi:hypothetical protein